MVQGPTAPVRRKESHLVPLLVVGAVMLALGAVAVFAIMRNTTKGAHVGSVDIRSSGPTLPLDLGAGDALLFRIDGEFGAPPGGDNKRRVRVLDGLLRTATLQVRLAGPDGRERTSTCPAYIGAGRQGDISLTTVKKSMVNDCTFSIDAPGRYLLRADVAWSHVDVRAATLDVRRQRREDR